MADAGSLTDFGANKALDNILGTAAYFPPSIKMVLCSTAPTDATAGTEISGGSYPAGGIVVTFQAAADRQAKINAASQTGMPTVTVVGYEFRNGSTGDRIDWGEFTEPRSFASGDTFAVAANELTVTVKAGS